MIKANKKHLALSIVALTLALMTTIGITYSWIDDVKLVEFNNDNLAKNGAPLKSGADINSTVVISNTNSSIDLGNILTNDDLTYTYTEGGAEKRHVKYPNTGDDADKTPDTDAINSGKGYFYESGDMHLSPCYSDGETFFFPVEGGGYREGNKDDENVNYISFTAKVSSPDANVDFWFEEVPSVKVAGTATQIANARYSISVDGKSHVYSSTGKANRYNGSAVEEYDVRKTSVYTYNNGENTTADRGANSNTLFSIKKGDTVNMTVKIWLENGTFTNVTASDISFKMVSSWKYTRDITVIDQTSSCKYIATNSNVNSSWLGNNPLYFTLPNILTKMCKEKYGDSASIRDWDDISGETGYEDAPFHNLKTTSTYVETGTTADGYSYFKVKNVPLVYKNEQMMLFRAYNAWNTGNYTTSAEYYGVKCYNWWTTYLPNSYEDVTFSLYGGSHDEFAERYFNSNVDNKAKTYQGYGTWGPLIKIQVDGRTMAISTTNDDSGVKTEYPSNNLACKENNNDSRDFYICDYSDKDTSGEVYVHGMSYEQSEECWFAFVPKSSTLLQFYYYNSYDSTKQGWWAYNSWAGDNPQQRPVNAYKYYLTHRMKHGGKYDGIGYWEGQEKVYLLRNGNIGTADHSMAYLYRNVGADDYDYNAADPGVDMTNTNLTDPRDTDTPIFEISTIADNNPGYYHYVQFAGKWNNSTTPVKSRRLLPMCPGCYFDWENDRWLGSLSGAGRIVEESSDDEEDDDPAETTDILTSTPTEDGVYLVGKLSGGNSENEYAKFDSSDAGGKVVLKFDRTKNYSIKVYKKQGNTTTTYANEAYNSQNPFALNATNNGWALSSSHSQKVQFFPNANGYFVAKIVSISGSEASISWEFKSSLE